MKTLVSHKLIIFDMEEQYTGGTLMALEKLEFEIIANNKNHMFLQNKKINANAYIYHSFTTIYKLGEEVYSAPDYGTNEVDTVLEAIKKSLE